MTAPAPITSPARRRVAWVATAVVLVVTGALAAGCSSSGSATATTQSLVKPPDLTLQGCTYVIGDKVPAGEPQGIQPPFAPFSPDQAATDALRHIQQHSGTGIVDGFTIPGGTELFAGPDSSAAPVGTVPADRSLLLADPVLFTTSSNQQWLATFLACGGPNLYWIDVSQIAKADAAAGALVANTITSVLKNPPYTQSGQVSTLPITIDAQHRFAWVSPHVTFAIGRGLYLGY